MSAVDIITESVLQGDLSYLQRIPMMLMMEGEQKVVKFIFAYQRRYGRPPSLDRMAREEWALPYLREPLSVPLPLQDVLDFTMETMRTRYVTIELSRLNDLAESTGSFPMGQFMQVAKLITSTTSDKHVSLDDFDRDDMYQEESSERGITLGFDILDEAMGGVFNGEMLTLVARPGVGKTQLLVQWAVRWAMQGMKVLVASMEMPPRQMVHRIDGVLGGFNPRIFRKARREGIDELRAKVNRKLSIMHELGGNIMFTNNSELTLQGIKAAADSLAPDIIIVDGIYLLRTDDNTKAAGWERVKQASNGLKLMALDVNVPVIATSQLGRREKGASATVPALDDIAYSDSIGQDSDFVVGLQDDNDVLGAKNLFVIKDRHGESLNVSQLYRYNWDLMETVDVAPTIVSGMALRLKKSVAEED